MIISNRYKRIKTIYRNDIPQCGQIDFCGHKSTTCYSREKGKSKKSLHAIKTLDFLMCSTPNPQGGFVQISPWHTINPHGNGGGLTPDPLKIKKKGGKMCLGVWGERVRGVHVFMHFFSFIFLCTIFRQSKLLIVSVMEV